MQLQTLPRGYVLDPRRQKRQFVDPEQVLHAVGLKERMVFADFGCGAGYFALPAATMVGEHGKVYAIDILKSVLQDIQGKARIAGLRNIQYVWADVEILGSTKIADDSVDIVFLAHIIHQSTAHPAILEEAKRVSKPDGIIAVVEWQKVKIPFGPPVEKRIAREDAIRVAQNAGLRLAAEFPAGNYHYGLIFKKSQYEKPTEPDSDATSEHVATEQKA